MDLWVCKAPLIWLCSSPFMVMSEGKMFFQSLLMLAMLSHQLESFQHTHSLFVATGMAMALGRKAVQSEEEHHWCVFNHQLCMGDAFGRNRRASCTQPFSGWPSARWPRHQQLHSAVRSFTPPDNCTSRSWVLGSCGSVLAHLPLDSLWQEWLNPLPSPCLSSKVPQQLTAHFTGVYFWTGSTNGAL